MPDSISKIILINLTDLERASVLLHFLGNPLRLRILLFLAITKTPQRVTEIVEASGCEVQGVVSQQLKILREAGIVLGERRANCVYYSIIDPGIAALLATIQTWLV
jgi:ArsR family transcriptional regulator, zinc-responsive transcriptional repressor